MHNPNDSTSQSRGGLFVATALGAVAIIAGIVTGSLATIAIGVAIIVGGALLLRISR